MKNKETNGRETEKKLGEKKKQEEKGGREKETELGFKRKRMGRRKRTRGDHKPKRNLKEEEGGSNAGGPPCSPPLLRIEFL